MRRLLLSPDSWLGLFLLVFPLLLLLMAASSLVPPLFRLGRSLWLGRSAHLPLHRRLARGGLGLRPWVVLLLTQGAETVPVRSDLGTGALGRPGFVLRGTLPALLLPVGTRGRGGSDRGLLRRPLGLASFELRAG